MSTQYEMPISMDALEHYRLDAKRRLPLLGLGAHLRRRLGQSLEFREYRGYVPGDDARAVDWGVSQRIGGPRDWLVRTFEAEEQLTVAISVDPRPTMYLPGDPTKHGRSGAEKIQVACWIARALAEIAAHEDDKVLLHRLFVPTGTGEVPPVTAGPNDARGFAEELLEEAPQNQLTWHRTFELNEASLLTALPPASALVILSDFYFEGHDGRFAEALVQAQRNYRQVVLVRLDSWPAERAILARGTSRIRSVEGIPLDDGLVDVDEPYLDEVNRRIERHVRHLLDAADAGGLVYGTWLWPETAERLSEGVRDVFEETFLAFDGFQSIFAKSV